MTTPPKPTNDTILGEVLLLAVPLWMDQLSRLPESVRDRRIQTWADQAADAVAYRGDALRFGGKRGEPAEVFNHLARGLAACAFQPGGISFRGVHWCTDHVTCEGAQAQASSNPLPVDPEPKPRPRRPIVDVYLPAEI